MSKTLRTAAMIVGAVALVATGVGAAAGVALGASTTGAAAATAASIAATAATVSSIATFAAVGLSIGATLTARKPSAMSTGNPDSFSADPSAPIAYIIGRSAQGGFIRRAGDSP